jgi:hypothetical protein
MKRTEDSRLRPAGAGLRRAKEDGGYLPQIGRLSRL